MHAGAIQQRTATFLRCCMSGAMFTDTFTVYILHQRCHVYLHNYLRVLQGSQGLSSKAVNTITETVYIVLDIYHAHPTQLHLMGVVVA